MFIISNCFLHIPIILLIVIQITSASISLVGQQEGTYGPDTFNVSGYVYIPYNKNLIFEPGSIIQFDKYSGIIVEGNLICKGDGTNKIIFTNTSEQDSVRWYGIELTSTGTTKLKNVQIKKSQFGLKIPNFDKNVVLNQVDFLNNLSSFTIGKTIVLPKDELDFAFGKETEGPFYVNNIFFKQIALVLISMLALICGFWVFKSSKLITSPKENNAKQSPEPNKSEIDEILGQNPPTSFFLPNQIPIDTNAFKHPEIALNEMMNSFKFYREHLNHDYKSLSNQARTSFIMWVFFAFCGLAQISSGFLLIYCDKFKEGAFTSVSTAVSFFILKLFQQREDHYRNLANKKHNHLEYGNNWILIIQSINLVDEQKNRLKLQIKLLQSLIKNIHPIHSETEEKLVNSKK